MKIVPGALRAPLAALLLAALTAIAYLPGLGGDFVFDDFANIVANKKVHAERLDWDALSRAASAYQGPIGRPLATVGFAVDHAIGGGSPRTFKVHNLLVHLAATLAMFALCLRLLAPAGAAPGAWPGLAAFSVAALWALHPLHVSSVLYIVQRMEMLATLFLLLGLVAYLAARRRQIQGRVAWPWFLAAIASAAAGLLAKESAVLFPLYTLALELTFLRFEAPSPAASRRLKRAYALLVLIGIAIFLALVVPRYAAPDSFANRDFTLYERLLSQARVLPMYLRQILVPTPGSLLFYYDNFPKSTGFLAPATTLGGTLLIVALLGLAWRARRAAPLFALGIFWFFSAHALTSNAVNLELAFEHRNYFALVGVLLAVVGLIGALPVRVSRDALAAMTVVIVLSAASLTAVRTATWGDPLLLAMDMVARNPSSPRASSDMGAMYARLAMHAPDSPYYGLAIREFERGARLPGSSPLPEQGLILMAASRGAPAEDWWWESLVSKLRTRPIGPQESMAVSGLLSNRNEGIVLDDRRLGEAYGILAERGGIPVTDYVAYARHAETRLQDRALAARIYVAAMASPRMTPSYAQQVLGAILSDGNLEAFEAAAREAKARGLVD